MKLIKTLRHQKSTYQDFKTFYLTSSIVSKIKKLLNMPLPVLLLKARKVRKVNVGPLVNPRILIEISNACQKNCYYCGLRRDNKDLERYFLPIDEVIETLKKAYYKYHIKSAVLQSGELTSKIAASLKTTSILNTNFPDYVAKLLKEIKKVFGNDFGITISFGEAPYEVYKLWRENGADRYLLRFESSIKSYYYFLHPLDGEHNFDERLECIENLRKLNYQVGTGFLVGTPFYTIDNLVSDLALTIFLDIDMVGLGPYIPHTKTPMYQYLKDDIPSKKTRIEYTLKALSALRILMPDINIASTTALKTLSKKAFIIGLKTAANVWMPTFTPDSVKKKYALYEGKEYDGILPLEEAKIEINLQNAGNSLRWEKRLSVN